MVKEQKYYSPENQSNKGKNGYSEKASKINASTPYDFAEGRLTSFGGVFALVKFFDVINFKELFETNFIKSKRKPFLGYFKMFYGIILLLFIGFNRLGQFKYIQEDPILCGIFKMNKLPDHSSFWRFLNSMGINQSNSILKLITALRNRIWELCEFNFKSIHIDIDTTVKTIYGDAQGARIGYNPGRKGKKGLRPILGCISETKEYIYGYLRTGKTVSGEEFAKYIRSLRKYIPSCVKNVTLRADCEFMSGQVCSAAEESGFHYILANKLCKPPFPDEGWYRKKNIPYMEFNSCEFEGWKWGKSRKFVALRTRKRRERKLQQQELFDVDKYKYRIFVTDLPGKAHKIIDEYDKRANVENIIAEVKREGIDALPSKKFKNNQAFFQIVLLTLNIWRYLKFVAAKAQDPEKKIETQSKTKKKKEVLIHPIISNTARVARLKLLFICAKIVDHSNQTRIRYSLHDNRIHEFKKVLKFLDSIRIKKKEWKIYNRCDFSFQGA